MPVNITGNNNSYQSSNPPYNNTNTNIGALAVTSQNAITITNQNKEVFKIGPEGKVFWWKDGDMKEANVDEDLSLAFYDVITNLTGFGHNLYRDKIKSEVKKEFYDSMPLKMKRQYKIHKLTQ